jgi:hypothetical protein
MRTLSAFLLVSMAIGTAEIVDRISVVVDSHAIKHSDILREIRLTDFLNRDKLDFSVAEQKKAASRLVDQSVIRIELDAERFAAPDASEAESLLQQVKKQFGGDAAYRRALQRYGITEPVLKQHLLWQITVLRFANLRFGAGEAVSDADVREYYQKHLREFKGGDVDSLRQQISDTIAGDRVNQQFFAWLDQSRKDTRIVFNEEDLQ